MIFTFLILILFATLTWVIGLMPNSTGIPNEIQQSLNAIITEASAWEYWFPLQTMLTILWLYIVWEFILYGWKTARYFIGLLRGTTA